MEKRTTHRRESTRGERVFWLAWVGSALVGMAVLGVIVWAVVRLVVHVT